MTAVHPVGDGQCIALGYESVLPLVLLTLQGGELKPYEFPTEGTTAMAETGAKFNDRSSSTSGVIVSDFQFQYTFLCIVFSLSHVSSQHSILMYVLLLFLDEPIVFEGIQNTSGDEDK